MVQLTFALIRSRQIKIIRNPESPGRSSRCRRSRQGGLTGHFFILYLDKNDKNKIFIDKLKYWILLEY